MKVLDSKMLAALNQVYEESPKDGLPFDRAIGLELPNIAGLQEAIELDLDLQNGGIAWWKYPHLGFKNRILVSDYLSQAVRSCQKNLCDAQLHFLSLMHFDSLEAHRLSDTAAVNLTGQLAVKHPRSTAPLDDLASAMADIHLVGFFRAVGSALDCLAAAVIGVAGLPLPIQQRNFGQVLENGWSSASRRSKSLGKQWQHAFKVTLEGFVSEAGPSGWLPWTNGMRNMYVHRARRYQVSNLRTELTGLLNAANFPILRSSPTQQLPLHPAWSDVEAFVATDLEPILSEPMSSTVEGIRSSAIFLCERTCAALLLLWRLRRAMPDLIKQPGHQWDKFCAAPTTPFSGYEPESLPFKPEFLVANPSFLRRLQAACVDDAGRHRWADER